MHTFAALWMPLGVIGRRRARSVDQSRYRAGRDIRQRGACIPTDLDLTLASISYSCIAFCCLFVLVAADCSHFRNGVSLRTTMVYCLPLLDSSCPSVTKHAYIDKKESPNRIFSASLIKPAPTFLYQSHLIPIGITHHPRRFSATTQRVLKRCSSPLCRTPSMTVANLSHSSSVHLSLMSRTLRRNKVPSYPANAPPRLSDASVSSNKLCGQRAWSATNEAPHTRTSLTSASPVNAI